MTAIDATWLLVGIGAVWMCVAAIACYWRKEK
jgi:uncharacterized membrane protein YuzA (DUF378 family)